ncbi:MAG TPA: M20/M25/M40 family metallo-hydrolase, partial [Patescibacteria group bacterium]|nr:M20/M25/M40 family metallo-hydrolase [Patescibacteria group bacterium]
MSTEILRELVETPSVFPNEAAISGKIKGMLLEYGFKVHEVPVEPGRNNIVGTFGESDRYLGFYGHMDTVPPHADYQQDPFTLKIEGDRATGLGVIDMKGGVAAILETAKFAAENNLPVKVLFGVDEENISKGAHALVDAGELDDVAFLVVGESGQVDDYDQDFALNYGRKGHLQYNIHVAGRSVHAA